MKTQNTTSNTAVSFTSIITPVNGISSAMQQLPAVAANDQSAFTDAGYASLADEASWWMMVATAFVFQLMLVNLITVI